MELVRIHAYEVKPQRLADSKTPPRGGAIARDSAFEKMLDDYFTKSKLRSQPTVNLRRHAKERGQTVPTHGLRENVINYCFGAPASAKSAAVAMATSLGRAMDDRSVFTLLMLAAYKDGPLRRLVMWAFPKDEPFHFSVKGERARIRVLEDAFSRSSAFKKAALFEGTNVDTSFWSGHVIDKQAEGGFGNAADYWVNLYLDSVPSLSGSAGTRLLARCLRKTHQSLASQSDKDQLSDAIVAVRASTKPQWSLQKFADEYLTDQAKTAFLDNTPPESRSASFTLNKPEFEQRINLRVFRLKDNVMVAAPFGTIGNSVIIEDKADQRRLKCEGVVVAENVRAQHAG